MKNIVMIPLSKLKNHESVSKERLEVVFNKIKSDGIFNKPVVVEKRELIILDGHHRVAALKKMGAKIIPVYLVDYRNPDIRIYLRRKDIPSELIKESVLRAVLLGKVFPYKTTRHYFSNRPKRIKVNLKELF